MFCEHCGTNIPEGAKFCPSCGASSTGAPHAAQAAAPPPVANTVPQAPYMAAYVQDTSPMSVGQYIVTFLLLCIPLANLVLLFVWGFGHSVNLNKRNLARAILVFAAISVILWIILGGVIAGMMGSMMGGGYYYGSY